MCLLKLRAIDNDSNISYYTPMSELIKEYLVKQAAGVPFADKLRQLSPGMKKVLSAGVGTGLGTAIYMPLDTISDTQKQWRNTKGEPELNRASHSFLNTAKELAHPKIRKDTQGGVKPFYAGAGGKLLKVVPMGATTWAAEDHISKLLEAKKAVGR